MAIVKTIGPASALPEEGFENYLSETTKIAVPFTTITNRAKIMNLAADGGVRFGIERISLHDIKKISDEFGPNGETVYGVVGDKYDQIRVIGGWNKFNTNTGQGISSANTADYVEVTFYGTGLNILNSKSGSPNIKATIDGGAEGADILAGPYSSVIVNRNYNTNQPTTVASGLSLGIHTIKIRISSGANSTVIHGFEILNEATQLDVRPNTAYIKGEPTSIAQTTTDYNSGFTNEYGTSGTKGGHVLVYADEDGVVKKDIQWAEVSQANLGSADHSNEEVIKKIHFREFGAGRTDDFSTLESALVDRAFTLDDGTTILTCNNCNADEEGYGEYIQIDPNNNTYFLAITFVGTGLDMTSNRANATASSYDVIVDGATVGTETGTYFGAAGKTFKVVSGLPYGTHTIKIKTNTLASGALGVSNFIVYGPKKPELPADSVELGSYYLMADFVANTTPGVDEIATGTLRKHCTREFIYNGAGWSIALDVVNEIGGFFISSTAISDELEYTFFGTGFELRFDGSNGINTTLELDGSSDFTGFTTNIYDSNTATFNDATGLLDGNPNPGAGLTVSGLSLGLHTIKFIHNTAVNFTINTLDIITPVHSPKQNKPTIQNALEVGSCALADGRNFLSIKDKDEYANWVQVVGIDSDVTTTAQQPNLVPMPDMSASIVTNGGPIQIIATVGMVNGTNGSVFYAYVDGVPLEGISTGAWGEGADRNQTTYVRIVDVEPGFHTVQLYWGTISGGTVTSEDKARHMIIKELKGD